MMCLEPFFPSSSPTPVNSTRSCSLQFKKPQYNIYIHRRGKKKKKKKKHTWGSRHHASQAPIKCNKKNTPIQGGVLPYVVRMVVVVAMWLSWRPSSSLLSCIEEVGCYGGRCHTPACKYVLLQYEKKKNAPGARDATHLEPCLFPTIPFLLPSFAPYLCQCWFCGGVIMVLRSQSRSFTCKIEICQ